MTKKRRRRYTAEFKAVAVAWLRIAYSNHVERIFAERPGSFRHDVLRSQPNASVMANALPSFRVTLVPWFLPSTSPFIL
jgi:hypothetical protein